MTSEYTQRGDARRSINLLWGIDRPRTRGPRPGFELATIVVAAIAVADAEGLTGLSMRRVAERVGVGTMSLYTYVPTKAELLDLMVDSVFGQHAGRLLEIDAAASGPPEERWRSLLQSFARVNWDLFLAHPWLLRVASSRAVLGPNESLVMEASLRAVDGLGLRGRQMVGVVDLLATYVRGAARVAAEAIESPAVTGMTDVDWWAEREAILIEIGAFDEARFPVTVRLAAQGAFDVDDGGREYTLQFAIDDFEFGLERVLDGIGALVATAVQRI